MTRPSMTRRPASPSRNDGHVLAVVLIVLLILMSACSLVALALRFQVDSQRLETRDFQLRALADAALAETLAELWNDRDFEGFETYPFADGTISASVRRLAFQSREVVVRTTWGGGARAVRALVWVDVKDRAEPPEVRSWELLPAAEALRDEEESSRRVSSIAQGPSPTQ